MTRRMRTYLITECKRRIKCLYSSLNILLRIRKTYG